MVRLAPEQMSYEKVMIVLGPGRSATSAVAQALHMAGWHMGDNLYPADEHNPEGYFEDILLRELNGTIIYTHGLNIWSLEPVDHIKPELLEEVVAYIETRDHPAKWGMKDVMMVLTWPYWKEAFKKFPHLEPILVTTFREPEKSAESFQRMGDRYTSEVIEAHQKLTKQWMQS